MSLYYLSASFNEGFICINTQLSRYFPDTSLLIVFNLCEQRFQLLEVSMSHFCHQLVLAPAVLTDFVYFTGRIQFRSFDITSGMSAYHKNIVKATKKCACRKAMRQLFTCLIDFDCNCKSAHITFYVCMST